MKYWEAITWSSVLVVLYFMDGGGPSLCLFKLAGFASCPGCGIGHAIHHALHFRFGSSVEAHLLGIPSTVLMVIHAGKSFYQSSKTHKPKNEPATAYNVTGPATR